VETQVKGWLELFDDDMRPKSNASSIPPQVLELLAKFEKDRTVSPADDLDLIDPSTPLTSPYPFNLDDNLFQFPGNSGSSGADLWFRRGIAWAHGFNFEEGARCFQQALDICDFSLGHWGLALCHGPYYNRHGARYVKEGQRKEAPTFNINRALEHAEEAERRLTPSSDSSIQSKLVRALCVRCRCFADNKEKVQTRQQLQFFFETCEREYADQLRAVFQAHPGDPNIAALFASSLMNLAPWRLWLPTDATPRHERKPAKDTMEILSVLRKGLLVAPNHPGLCHLWIHAMEMAPDPSLASEQADFLFRSNTDVAHLSHMSAHIYMQLGNYVDAIKTSQKSVLADEKLLDAGAPFVGTTAVRKIHCFKKVSNPFPFNSRSSFLLLLLFRPLTAVLSTIVTS
jgi:tetratricopeptide (TPR) repeat protein